MNEASQQIAESSEQRKFIARFWNKVSKAGPNDCWLWEASKYLNGYGAVMTPGHKLRGAHRMAWKITNGAIPDGLCVLYRCDVRLCVNPAHLWLGTRKENTRDMYRKGRAPIGENHGLCRLTENTIKEIRKRYARGDISQPRLAKEYNISFNHVHRIITKKRWSHVA